MREAAIQQRIMLAIGQGLSRVFRVNTGVAWQGKRVDNIRGNARMVMCHDGDVVVRGAQPIRMGLCVGGSDLIGWTSRVMQPDDVGRRYAVFTAVEVKAPRGRVTEDQAKFLDAVQAAGGLAGVARSEDEARAILADER